MSLQDGIIIHVTTGEIDGWQTALRNLRNLVQDESVPTPPARIEVMVNGPAVRFLLASSPDSSKVSQVLEAGVGIGVCSNSLARFGHDPDDLVDGVRTVSSGVAEVVRMQAADNSYLKLP
jgi:intracellular sulfur oxidation DsrE/DsrF family protein